MSNKPGILKNFIAICVIMVIAAIITPKLYSLESEVSNPFTMSLKMNRFMFTEDDPVTLHMVVKNNSSKKESFVIYDSVYTTYQPVVYNTLGREAEITVPYRLMNKRVDEVIQDINPRIIELMPNEKFVYMINLKKIYNLELNTEYRVKGYFMSDIKNTAAIASENVISFKITRSTSLVRRSGVKRITRDISPSEVVMLLLNAEKNGNWNNFLKYIKIESFINAFPEYVRLYNNADEIEKLKIIEEFVTFLSRNRPDYIREFNVVEETLLPDKNISYVDAVVKRHGPRAPFVYRYRYTLERFKDFWLVIDVEASVMKGEQ